MKRGADFAANLLHSGIVRQVLQKLGSAVVELLHLAVGEHDGSDQFRIDGDPGAGFQIRRQLEHLEDQSPHAISGGIEQVRRHGAALGHLAAESVDGIGVPPSLDFFLRAVARCIRWRVAADPVGDGIQERRPFALQEYALLAPESVDDGQRIVPVDPLGVHLLGIHPRPDARDEPAAHGLAARLPAHPVMVVHAVEQDWQAPAQRLIPEHAVLVHAGKRDAFPDRTAAEGGVADVGHHDARLAIHSLEECCAGSDGTGPADDGVVGVDAEGREKRVHGAAQSAVQPGLAGEDLAVGAVDEEAEREIPDPAGVSRLQRAEDGSVAVASHDLQQTRVGQLTDGGECLGEDLPVAAVRAINVVVGSQCEGHADGGRFLPDRKMGGTGVVVCNSAIRPFELDLIEDGLELADGAHVLPYGQQFGHRERPQIRSVGVDWNIRKMDGAPGKYFFRFNNDGFWHFDYVLIANSDSTCSILRVRICRNLAPGAPSIT